MDTEGFSPARPWKNNVIILLVGLVIGGGSNDVLDKLTGRDNSAMSREFIEKVSPWSIEKQDGVNDKILGALRRIQQKLSIDVSQSDPPQANSITGG